jgi:Transposase DDE domain group 1
MAQEFIEQFIASYERPPKLIVLDFDDTEDPAHGQQEHIRYDGYYGAATASCPCTSMRASQAA